MAGEIEAGREEISSLRRENEEGRAERLSLRERMAEAASLSGVGSNAGSLLSSPMEERRMMGGSSGAGRQGGRGGGEGSVFSSGLSPVEGGWIGSMAGSNRTGVIIGGGAGGNPLEGRGVGGFTRGVEATGAEGEMEREWEREREREREREGLVSELHLEREGRDAATRRWKDAEEEAIRLRSLLEDERSKRLTTEAQNLSTTGGEAHDLQLALVEADGVEGEVSQTAVGKAEELGRQLQREQQRCR